MADPQPSTASTIAAAVVELARDERFAQIEEMFAPRLRAMVSVDSLRTAWTAEISKLGLVTAVGEPEAS